MEASILHKKRPIPTSGNLLQRSCYYPGLKKGGSYLRQFWTEHPSVVELRDTSHNSNDLSTEGGILPRTF